MFSYCTPEGMGAVAPPASASKKNVSVGSNPYQLPVCTGTAAWDAGTTL